MGKHTSSRPSVKRGEVRSARGRALIYAAVALVGALAVGGTIAYLTDGTERVVNAFEPVEVTCAVTETFANNVKSNVGVQNTGDVDAYVRVAVVINWVDAEGNVLGEVPDGYGYELVGGLPASEKWLEGDDGYWYYADPVGSGMTTGESLIDSIEPTFSGEGVQECFLSVEILSGAIQAEPAGAFNEAWGASSGLTANNGVLTLSAGE